MQTLKYVHWKDGKTWIGYLQDYPDYWTQGESLDDLIVHLRDLLEDFIPNLGESVRKVGELVLS